MNCELRKANCLDLQYQSLPSAPIAGFSERGDRLESNKRASPAIPKLSGALRSSENAVSASANVPEADFGTEWHICSANPGVPNKEDNCRGRDDHR